MLLLQFEDLSNSQGVTEVLFNNYKEVILSNCQIKQIKRCKTQNKIKNMQNAKNLKRQNNINKYKQIQYKI